ncbi:MAG: TAXI family TRAP transporter solute-binding subunit, partial [Solirubrobacteraceae bacterium]
MKRFAKFLLAPGANLFTENFGLSRALSWLVTGFISLMVFLAVFWFVHTAPPRTVIMTSGPPGSSFEHNAEKYRAILARNGVSLKILTSEGSLDNLERLQNPAVRVDIGFVQGGMFEGTNTQQLVSLGSVAYEPLLVFYRNPTPIGWLGGLAGKRLAIGPPGSGTRTLALSLLQTNGITAGGKTTFLDLDAGAASRALLAGSVDAVFLMSDSASVQIMRTLLRSPGVRLLSFEQADAYTRRFTYLNKLCLPEGSIDFGQNLPLQDVWLIGPTVELIARPHLNSAVSDLLLEASQEVYGHASLLQNQGEFPKPLAHEFKLSADAARYYKSGKTFLYSRFPFWLASLLNRFLVAFVPMIIILIPGLRLIPAVYKWRFRMRFQRWYRNLVVLERELSA